MKSLDKLKGRDFVLGQLMSRLRQSRSRERHQVVYIKTVACDAVRVVLLVKLFSSYNRGRAFALAISP